MTETAYAIGFDVGGTSLKAALVHDGKILHTVNTPTPAEAEPAVGIQAMVKLIEELKSVAQGTPIVGVGMGFAGLIDGPQGVVITSPNMPRWQHVPLAEQVEQHTQLPVFIDNDVRAMALGEQAYGAGQGAQNMLCMTVGTGVGSAIILNGEIYRGSTLTAGELGHMMVVHQGGRTCGCGNRGCLETVAGTEGILTLAQQYLKRGLAPVLQRLLSQGQALTPQLIYEAAIQNDAGAIAVFTEVGQWLGQTLAGVVNLLNPERIVIGGGIAQAGDFILEPLRTAIQLHAFERPASGVQVLPARLGAEAGMIGAAVLAETSQRN